MNAWRRKLRRLLPVVLFAAVLALIQWASLRRLTALPLLTVAVFLLCAAVAGMVRWTGLIFRARPGSRRYTALLFALFVRHFALVLGTEARRLLTARRLAAPRAFGGGAARSLVFAVAALFTRSFTRAERFFAAQSLRGLAE